MIKKDWPQSLTDFLNDIKKLSMPREEVNDFPLSILHQEPVQSVNKNTFSLPALTRNMTAKKIHEVAKLSSLVSCIANTLGPESGISFIFLFPQMYHF